MEWKREDILQEVGMPKLLQTARPLINASFTGNQVGVSVCADWLVNGEGLR